MTETDTHDGAIVKLPESVTSLAQPASIAEIELMVRRAEFMGEKLDQLRKIAVARTFPSDWILFGKEVYLEANGAFRLHPIIGFSLTNVQKQVEVDDGGVVMVTMTGDASSKLFGTHLERISRTRRSDEPYLKGGVEDVESAAYKGLVARATQLVAGLSGITPEELRDRYGMTVGGSVQFKTGAADARKADQATAGNERADIERLLVKLSDGDAKFAEEILEGITKNEKQGWVGKRRAADLTEAGVRFSLRELLKREAEFDSVAKK